MRCSSRFLPIIYIKIKAAHREKPEYWRLKRQVREIFSFPGFQFFCFGRRKLCRALTSAIALTVKIEGVVRHVEF